MTTIAHTLHTIFSNPLWIVVLTFFFLWLIGQFTIDRES